MKDTSDLVINSIGILIAFVLFSYFMSLIEDPHNIITAVIVMTIIVFILVFLIWFNSKRK